MVEISDQNVHIVGTISKKMIAEAYCDYRMLIKVQGTVVMVLLLVSSLDRIRISSYEFFLITHIFLSVLTLIGCF